MAHSSDATISSLVEYAPSDDSELYDDLHLTIIHLDRNMPLRRFNEAAGNVGELIDENCVNLSALLDVIHKAIISQETWASWIAIELYRTLFENIDLDFIINDDQPSRATVALELVKRAIIEKGIRQLESDFDWSSAEASNVLEFVEKFFGLTSDRTLATATGNVIVRMFKSPYLLFQQNLDIFHKFAMRLEPGIYPMLPQDLGARIQMALQRICRWEEADVPVEVRATEQLLPPFSSHQEPRPTNTAQNDDAREPRAENEDNANFTGSAYRDSSCTASRVNYTYTNKFEELSAEDQACFKSLYKIDALKDYKSDDEAHVKFLAEFDAELDWGHGTGTVQSIIDRMQIRVKIGASQKDIEVAYVVIYSMVKSVLVFREKNLLILATFLLRIGPVLDAMAGSIRSTRLTRLLKTLKQNPSERTEAQERDIDAVCRHLGRDPSGVDRQDIRDDEEGGVSLLV